MGKIIFVFFIPEPGLEPKSPILLAFWKKVFLKNVVQGSLHATQTRLRSARSGLRVTQRGLRKVRSRLRRVRTRLRRAQRRLRRAGSGARLTRR